MPTTDPGITDTHPLRPLFPATAHSITVTTLGLTIVILAFTLLSAPCSSTIRARYPGMALCAFIGGLIWLQSESEWTRHPLHLVPFVSSSTQLSCSPLAQFVFGLPMWLAATIVPLIQFYSRAYLSTHDSSNVWPTMFLLPLLLLPGALLLRFVDITQGTCTTLFLDGGADYSLQHNGHHDNDDGDDETCCLKDGWTVVLAQLCLLYVSLYAWLMMKLWVVREQVSWFKHHVMLGVSGLLVAACHVVVYVYAAVTSSHEVFGTRDVGQTAHEFLMVLDTLLITVIPVWSRFLPIVSSCSCCCEPDHVGYGPRSTATSSGGSYGENVVRGRVPNAVHAEHTTSPAGSGHYDAPPPYTPALAQDRRHRQRQSPAYGAITHVQPGAAHADSCQQERATLDPPPYTPSPNVRRFPRHSRQSIPNFSDPPTEQSSLLTQHQLQQQQQQQQYQQQHHNHYPHGHRPAPAAPSAASANNPSPTAPPVPHHLLRLFQPPEDVRVPGVIQQQHLPPPPPPPSPPPLQSQHASHQQHNGQHPRATSPNMLQLESLDDDVSAVAYGRKYYN